MNRLNGPCFLDDTFIDPYLLKSWLYQYIDYRRSEEDGKYSRKISKTFPKHLWEKNIPILEKALTANNEAHEPDYEGNIHLNMANNYYLLLNYPRALHHYKMAQKYKSRFDSKIDEALFYFHFAYSYWQNGEIDEAKAEINRALSIYKSMARGKNIKRYKKQVYILYKYIALFNRWEKKYNKAIKWYRKIIDFAGASRIQIDRARYYQELPIATRN